MSFNTFLEICDAFFDELKPNIYGEEEQEQEQKQEQDETKYHFCLDLSRYIIYLLTLFGFEIVTIERVAIEGNDIKHHVY